MPIYEYVCPVGHMTTDLRKMSDADAPAVCSCGEKATRAISLPAAGVVTGSHTPLKIVGTTRSGYVEEAPGVWVKGSSIDPNKVLDWRCTACPTKDVAVDEPIPPRCPSCGAAVEVYDNPKVRHTDWFPPGGYYDRALGMFLTSRAHRAQVLAEKGLREADSMEIDGRFREASAVREKEDASIKAMLEEWDDDKERQRAVDQGEIPDHTWAKEVMGM